MKCTNCEASIPRGSTVCPECGVFAGDEPPRPGSVERRAGGGRRWVWVVVALIAAGAGGWWYWYTRYGQFPKPDTGPVRVVHDRPGGNVGEAQATLALRHYLAGQMKADCIAVMSRGYSNGYYSFDAVDSCQRTRLGRFRVDPKTHAVQR